MRKIIAIATVILFIFTIANHTAILVDKILVLLLEYFLLGLVLLTMMKTTGN